MEKKRHRKGSGRVFQPKFKRDNGEVALGSWRIRYTWNKRTYEEKVPESWPQSARGAQSFLDKRKAERRNGEYADQAKDLTFEQIRDALLDYYELNGKRSLHFTRDRKGRYILGQRHLEEYFTGRRANEITSAEVSRFVLDLRRKAKSNTVINSSLECLRQMFSLSAKNKKVNRNEIPEIALLPKPPARQGFIEPSDFPAIYAALPEDLRLVLMIGFDTGMRKGEVQRLKWSGVDLLAGEIRLTAEETKTLSPRTIPLGRMLEPFRRLRAQRPNDVYVFGGSKPLGNFRKRWFNACAKVGFGKFICKSCSVDWIEDHDCGKPYRKYVGRTFHDLRRSASRNLIRSGVSESVAMKITGHATNSVFKRYNITSTQDIHDAVERSNTYVERSIEERQRKVELPADENRVGESTVIQ